METFDLAKEVSETHKDEKIDMVRDKFPRAFHTGLIYGIVYGHQSSIKIFLIKLDLQGFLYI